MNTLKTLVGGGGEDTTAIILFKTGKYLVTKSAKIEGYIQDGTINSGDRIVYTDEIFNATIKIEPGKFY